MKLLLSTLSPWCARPQTRFSVSHTNNCQHLQSRCSPYTFFLIRVTHAYQTIIYTTVTTITWALRRCPSFSTHVDIPAPWSSCTFNTATCLQPACLLISTITQPYITDKYYTRTATDTVYAPCLTECPAGCAASWTVLSS